MLAYRLTRAVLLRLKKEDWPILFTHAALLDIEEQSGCDVMAGEFNIYRPRADWVRVALWAALKQAGAGLGLAEAGALIRPQNGDRVHLALMDGWRASMAQPEEDAEGSGKPKLRTWIEAWAIGRGRLKLSDQEWLDMTPRMLQEISRVELEQTRQQEAMFSRLTASVINWSARPPTTAVDQDAFMLHPYKKQPSGEPPMITGEYLSAMLGGNVFQAQ